MSNKGLLLFVFRALLVPLALLGGGVSIYWFAKWWDTAGAFSLSLSTSSRGGEIMLASCLLVYALAIAYLSIRPTPSVKSLLPEPRKHTTLTLDLAAAAGAEKRVEQLMGDHLDLDEFTKQAEAVKTKLTGRR